MSVPAALAVNATVRSLALSRLTLFPMTVPAVLVMLPAEVSTVLPVALPMSEPTTMLLPAPVVLNVVLPVLAVFTPPVPVVRVPAAVTSYTPVVAAPFATPPMLASVTASNSLTYTLLAAAVARAASVVAAVFTRARLVPTPVALSRVTSLPRTTPTPPVMLPTVALSVMLSFNAPSPIIWPTVMPPAWVSLMVTVCAVPAVVSVTRVVFNAFASVTVMSPAAFAPALVRVS